MSGGGAVNMRLIDADVLQRKICGAKCGCEYEDCGNEGDCEFAHFIFWAPTVDAEPVRHGKWVDKTVWLRGVGLCRYECSYCGYVVDSKPGSRGSGKGGKYCDECGAKMVGD